MKIRSCLVCIDLHGVIEDNWWRYGRVFITKHPRYDSSVELWLLKAPLLALALLELEPTPLPSLPTLKFELTSPWSWTEIKAELSPKDLKRLFLEPSHIQERYFKVLALIWSCFVFVCTFKYNRLDLGFLILLFNNTFLIFIVHNFPKWPILNLPPLYRL